MKTECLAPECPPDIMEEKPAKLPPPVWLVLLAFAAVYIIWGSTFLGIRLAIETIPPLLMAGTRFLIAGLILYGVVRATGTPRPEAVHWRDAFVIGLLLLVVGNGGVTLAEESVPTNVAALVIAGTPLWIIVVDWLRPGGRRPHALVFGGLLLGYVGVAFIVGGKSHTGGTLVDLRGAVLLLAASVCWACGSVFQRHARQPASPLLAIFMQMILGGGAMLALGALFGETGRLDLAAISATSWWSLAYLTFFGSMVGFTSYVWLLRVNTPARVSTYAYVNPLIAVLLGYLVLHEPLPGGALVAGLFILGAVALITIKGQAAKK